MAHKKGCNVTYKLFSRYFNALGRHVAKSPNWFIVIPVFTSLFLATGLQRIKAIRDVTYFVTIDNSETGRNRDLIESLFPMDITTDFDLGRYTRVGRFATVIIKAKNNDSLLREDIAKEIIKLDNAIDNITIESGSKTLRYKDFCVRSEGRCYKNDVLSLYRNNNGNFSFKYPIEFDRNYGFKFYGSWMSGVEVNKEGTVISVKVIRLIYFVDKSELAKDHYTALWVRKFLEDVDSMDFKFINVITFVSKSIEYEMENTIFRALPYMIIASVIVMIFTISTCSIPNWIQGKPWTGLTTAIGAGLASFSGFGLVAYLGLPYLYYNILIPFLVLGVSMDDTFVFLAAWRRTSQHKSVEDRLGQAYAESAIAISLTSATNIFSFAIGALMSPFPCVRVFCILTSCCLAFDYIYQITFVGACMAILGYAEKQNRHCFTMIPVKPPKSTEGPKSCIQKILFHTGHYSLDLQETSYLLTMWDKVGCFLTKTVTKVFILIMFGIYFAIGAWSARSLHSELETKNMAFYDSPIYHFLQESTNYFRQYIERIQVVIPTTLDYSNPKTQETLRNMFKKLESTGFVCNSTMTESWLKSYSEFLVDPRYTAITSSYNITDKRDFIKALRELFLHHPAAKRFKKDIAFNKDYTEILASRFLFQTNYTKDDSTFNKMWWKFQQVAKNFSIPVIVFHRFGYFSEGFRTIIPVTIQTLAAATCAVAAVSYIFLCSIRCTICITFCIVSIIVGILGYMNIWGVNMNVVSMTIIMLVSGFSVDYSSHMACSYISAFGTSSEKLKKSVRDVGLPIFQASITTVLTILVFVVPPSYSFLVLFKIIFLLSVFAGVHALIFLPIFLSLLEDLFKYLNKTLKRKYNVERSINEKHAHINHGVDLSKTEVDSIQRSNSKTESSAF